MPENSEKIGNRAERILQAVVQHYMTHAQATGSEALQRDYALPWSAATIRSEMAWLERHDFLSHAHTSSGRFPTAQGIRYFVNHLLEAGNLTAAQRLRIQAACKQVGDDPIHLMMKVAQILSRCSQQLSLVQVASDSGPNFAISGQENFLGEPEFDDVVKLKDLFRVLEEADLRERIFRNSLLSRPVHVLIGSEDFPAPYQELFADVGAVTTTYGTHERAIGSIGIFGPKRMDYRQVIPLVAFTAETLGQNLA